MMFLLLVQLLSLLLLAAASAVPAAATNLQLHPLLPYSSSNPLDAASTAAASAAAASLHISNASKRRPPNEKIEHDTETLGSVPLKIIKKRNYKREWRANNRDEVNRRQREWAAKNRDEVNRMQREWYAKNREEMKRKQREWCARNREKVKRWHCEWQSKNREEVSRKQRERNAKNREEVNRRQRECYAKKKPKRQRHAKERMLNAEQLSTYCQQTSPLMQQSRKAQLPERMDHGEHLELQDKSCQHDVGGILVANQPPMESMNVYFDRVSCEVGIMGALLIQERERRERKKALKLPKRASKRQRIKETSIDQQHVEAAHRKSAFEMQKHNLQPQSEPAENAEVLQHSSFDALSESVRSNCAVKQHFQWFGGGVQHIAGWTPCTPLEAFANDDYQSQTSEESTAKAQLQILQDERLKSDETAQGKNWQRVDAQQSSLELLLECFQSKCGVKEHYQSFGGGVQHIAGWKPCKPFETITDPNHQPQTGEHSAFEVQHHLLQEEWMRNEANFQEFINVLVFEMKNKQNADQVSRRKQYWTVLKERAPDINSPDYIGGCGDCGC